MFFIVFGVFCIGVDVFFVARFRTRSFVFKFLYIVFMYCVLFKNFLNLFVNIGDCFCFYCLKFVGLFVFCVMFESVDVLLFFKFFSI